MNTYEYEGELATLVRLMRSVSLECEVGIFPIRDSGKIRLVWINRQHSHIRTFDATFNTTQANLKNIKFVHALQDAKKAMRD